MLISSSASMENIINLAEKASHYQVNVLVLGETGCGKELIARHIHETSKCNGKFMSVNCTALPKELLENELFGHNKGAFTGAYTVKKGILEEAHDGTLLLDEIGDMPISLQPKLLRVLDTKKFMSLGSTKSKTFSARAIATTNKDLTNQDNFRQDLYFRLATVVIKIPPLRKRPDDIISLTNYFLGKIQEDFNLEKFSAIIEDKRIYDLLLNYSWPGNVRELQNILKKAVILGDGHLKYQIVDNIINENIDFFNNANNVFTWKIENCNKDECNLRRADKALETYIIKYIIATNPKIAHTKIANIVGISYPTLLARFRNILNYKGQIQK